MVFVALYDVGVLQTHLLTGGQTHKLLLCFLHKIIALNPEFTAEFDSMCAVGLILRVVHGCELFHLPLRIVGNHHLHWVKYSTYADGTTVQVVTYGTL